MGEPLQNGVDLRPVFLSKYLEGLHGLKPVLAKDDYMCGPAALATIVGYFRDPVTAATVADRTKTSRQLGAPWQEMMKYVGSNKLRVTITNETPAHIIKGGVREKHAMLLDWADWPGHWVLVCGWDAVLDTLVLMDPCKKPSPFVGMRWKDFCTHWDPPNAQLMLEIYPPANNTRSFKGMEGLSVTCIRTWEYVHNSSKRRKTIPG